MKKQNEEERITKAIYRLADVMRRDADNMVTLIEALKQHTKNRIAAHRAHTTMAKRGKEILPQRTQRAQRKLYREEQ